MLDLSNKTGVAFNAIEYAVDGVVIANLSGMLETDFDGVAPIATDTGIIRLFVDATVDVDATTFPTSLLDANGNEVLEPGTKLRVVKTNNNSATIKATDAYRPTFEYGFVNRAGEYMDLELRDDAGTLTWGA